MIIMTVVLTSSNFSVTLHQQQYRLYSTGDAPSAWQPVLRVTKFWQRQAQTTKRNTDSKHNMNPVQAYTANI
jgi:hypothetical protein